MQETIKPPAEVLCEDQLQALREGRRELTANGSMISRGLLFIFRYATTARSAHITCCVRCMRIISSVSLMCIM